MADEPVAGASAELGLTIDGFLKALDKAGKAGVNFEKSIQREMDKISGAKATTEAQKIGIAFERLGGVSKVTGQQLENLRTRIDALSKAGAKLPSSLAGLSGSGSGLGQLGKNLQTQAFGQLQGQLGPLGGLLSGVSGGALAAAAGIGAMAVAAGAAGAATASAIKEFATFSSHLTGLSVQTGISTTALQEIAYAGSFVNLSLDEITSAVTKMQAKLVEGDTVFERLGLNLKELQGLKPEEAFLRVAEAINRIEDPNRKIELAKEAFDKFGVTLLKVMPNLRELMEQAHEAGAVLGEEMVAKGAKLDDAFTRLSNSWEGLKRSFAASAIGEGLGDFLDSIAGHVANVSNNLPELIRRLKELRNASLGAGGAQPEWVGSVGFASDATTPAAGGTSPKTEGERRKRQEAAKKHLEEQKKLLKEINDQYDKINKAELELNESLAEGVAQIEVFAKSLADAFAALSNKQMLDNLFKLPETIAVPQAQMNEAVLRQQLQDTILADRAEKERIKNQKTLADEMLKAGQISKTEYAQIVRDLGLADQNTLKWSAALQGVTLLAGSLGDSFVGVVGILGNIQQSFSDINLNPLLTDAEKAHAKFVAIASAVGQIGGLIGGKAGGFLQGAAGGALAGSAFGPIGAAIGGALGGLAGLFGAGKKQAEQLKKKQKEATDAFTSAFDQWKAASKELGALGAEGVNNLVGALFDESGKFTGEFTSAGNAAAYVAAQFQALLKAGYSTTEALEALGPAAQAMLKDPKQFQGTAAAPLLQLVGFATANEKLLQFVEGLGQTASSLAGFGLLTQELATSIGTDLANSIDKMIGKGLTQEQASALSAQALYNLQQAAQQSGVTLDAHTQKLIDDAEAAGLFKNLEDPLEKVVEATQATAVAMASLVSVMGGQLPQALQNLINEFNNAHVTFGPPDTTTTTDPTKEIPQFATGGIAHAGTGMLAMLHGDEAIIPLSGSGGRGGMAAMPISYSPVIHINGSGLNEDQLLRVVDRALLNDKQGLRTRVRRIGLGKS